MSDWMPAHKAPPEWEGKLCWQWIRWDKSLKGEMRLERLPTGFSRNPAHCRGIWVMPPIEPPAPPNDADV